MASEAQGEVAVPPTLRALLAARLDQLDTLERSVLERGAVEGEIFHRGAVQALSDNGQVTPRLASLVRKQLIRPDRAQLAGRRRLPLPPPADPRRRLRRPAQSDQSRTARALADWLEEHGDELVEPDEISATTSSRPLVTRPSWGSRTRRWRSGRASGSRPPAAALSRADERRRCPLLERALGLTRPLRLDVHLELDLAACAIAGAAREAGGRAGGRARSRGGRPGRRGARPRRRGHARTQLEADPAVDELERLAQAALPLLERAEDDLGLASVWTRSATASSNIRGRSEEWTHAAEHALRQTRKAGRHPSGVLASSRARPRAASGRRGAAGARLRPAGEPASPMMLLRAEPACHARRASRTPGHSLSRRACATVNSAEAQA